MTKKPKIEDHLPFETILGMANAIGAVSGTTFRLANPSLDPTGAESMRFVEKILHASHEVTERFTYAGARRVLSNQLRICLEELDRE